jgi:hypothetical protein
LAAIDLIGPSARSCGSHGDLGVQAESVLTLRGGAQEAA